jgi:hypothetical protein
MNSAGARHETKKRINSVNLSGHLAEDYNYNDMQAQMMPALHKETK